MHSVKAASWVQAKSKGYTTVSVQEPESTCEDIKTLRRSHGLDTFPNVLLFRTCVPSAGNRNKNSFNRSEL